MGKKITIADDPSRALIKAIAMDIGKEVVHYIGIQYPQAISATSSTFKLSVRNCIYNQIMAALEVTDEGKVMARLQDRRTHRRKSNAAWKILRETDWEAYRAKNKCPYYPGCTPGNCTKCWENDVR